MLPLDGIKVIELGVMILRKFPFSAETLSIKYSKYYLSSSYLTIYNPLGEILHSSLIKNPITLLPTESLSPGIYFIQLYQSGINSTKSFIKW